MQIAPRGINVVKYRAFRVAWPAAVIAACVVLQPVPTLAGCIRGACTDVCQACRALVSGRLLSEAGAVSARSSTGAVSRLLPQADAEFVLSGAAGRRRRLLPQAVSEFVLAHAAPILSMRGGRGRTVGCATRAIGFSVQPARRNDERERGVTQLQQRPHDWPHDCVVTSSGTIWHTRTQTSFSTSCGTMTVYCSVFSSGTLR